MDFQTTLHEAIKARLTEVRGTLQFGDGESRMRRLYHLKNLEDNLYEPMNDAHLYEYGLGSGGELEWKMNSIRSSSAMTYNLLGNGPVAIKNGDLEGSYEVKFEYQLPTLNNSPRKANFDAYLKGEGTDIYCEMKMLEWLAAPHHVLRSAYLVDDKYYLASEEAECFVRLFGHFVRINANGMTGNDEWVSDDRYDGLQMAKHLLAIYNKVSLDSEYRPNRVVLLNCVWEMTNPEKLGSYQKKYLAMLNEEHQGFESFRKLTLAHIKPMFDEKEIDLDVRYVSVTDFIDMIRVEPDHADFLQRYIV